MIKFKKDFSIKIISIIITVSFIVTSNVYPDTFSGKSFLRKPLDFKNSETTQDRYAAALNAFAAGNTAELVKIQTKEGSRKANNISPIRRVTLGGLAASLLLLSFNLIRYFVIAPNYLEPLRYGGAITAIILVGFVIFLMLPEIFIGRSIFSVRENKGSKIRLTVLIAAMLSLAPNIFLYGRGIILYIMFVTK